MDLEGFIVVAPSAAIFADHAPDRATIWVVILFETQPGLAGIPYLKECLPIGCHRELPIRARAARASPARASHACRRSGRRPACCRRQHDAAAGLLVHQRAARATADELEMVWLARLASAEKVTRRAACRLALDD